ncbi:MAG: ABC transporter ATP-binding protein [Flavobacteriales bacterium]|nr:ABC transporter ATP-binding protein [Flavobacteriales bacterium]
MKAPDIRVERLVKRYRSSGINAVDGLDLEVMPGEFIGLLGPNGAGKTTLISILTGVMRPTAGSVRIQGHDIAKERHRIHRLIGFVPQDIALYGEFTARENLAFFGRLQGLDGTTIRERGDRLLDRAGLLPRAGDQVRHWSGGMQRRLNLITALLHQPAIVFLDEPTAGIDVQSRALIRDLLAEIHAEGATLVYTSHHLEEVERLCTRAVIVDHGKLVAEVADLRTGTGHERLEDIFLHVTGRELRDRS